MKTLILTTTLLILAVGLTGCIAISGHHHHGHVSHEVIVAHPPDIVVWSAPPSHPHPGRPVPGPYRPGPRHPLP